MKEEEREVREVEENVLLQMEGKEKDEEEEKGRIRKWKKKVKNGEGRRGGGTEDNGRQEEEERSGDPKSRRKTHLSLGALETRPERTPD